MRRLLAALAAVVGVALAGIGAAAASAATSANPILFLSNRAGDREIYVVNRDGTGLHRLTFNNIFERAPRWSPDGTRIAFAGFVNGNWDIYTIAADGSGMLRVTTDPGVDNDPAWAANGKRIVYDRDLFGDAPSLRIVDADGTDDRALDVGPGGSFGPDVRGGRVAFANNRTGTYAIYTMPLEGGHPRQITEGSLGWDHSPRWSPGGNEIVFLRNVANDDNNDIYVARANGTGVRQLTDTPNVTEFNAAWSPDGQELVYFARSGGPNRISVIRADGSGSAELSTKPLAPFEETFDDGIVDNSLWHTINDPGGSIGEVNGRLEASISGTAEPGGPFNQVDEHIGSQCSLNGDYDYQVDFTLVTWPSHSGFFANLHAFFDGGAIARTSAPWDPPYDEQYNGWTNTPFANGVVNTTDLSGQFRLVRASGVLYAYERNLPALDWTLVHSGAAPGNNVVGMGLFAQAWSFAHQDGLVAFDNFRLNSGEFTCPSWWDDAWPDWQPAGEDED